MRGIAILSVVAFHYHEAWPTTGGFLGVELFFVLSGFLITSILAAEFRQRGSIGFRAFYLRRAVRLLPALAVVLAFVSAYAFTLNPPMQTATLREVAATIGYGDNWYQAFLRPPQTLLGHAWSLSVEEQFYLLWPVLLVVVLRKFGRRWALVVAISGASLSALARSTEWLLGASDRYTYNSLEGRMDALLIGAALALLARPVRPNRLVFAGACAVIVTMLVVGPTGTFLYTVGLTLFALSTAVLIAGSQSGNGHVRRLLETRPLTWLGLRSYGIYLWQQPIYLVLLAHMSGSLGGNVGPAALSFLLTLAVAAISYRYLEQPLLARLRARSASRNRAAPAGAAEGAGLAEPLAG